MDKLKLNICLLDESIEHWGRLLTGTGGLTEGPTGTDCPLCCYQDETPVCKGCPIFQDTLQTMCSGTPFSAAYDRWDYIGGKPERGFKTAARKELAYLKALRKKLARKLKTEGSAT